MRAPVLVVEDDPTLVRAIARNLAVVGYDVRTATTVEEAVTVLRRQLPALVVLDISLPDGCGWEVVRELAANRGESVPVVVVSALALDSRFVSDECAVAVFEKPFAIEDLVRLVARIVDGPQERVGRPRLKEMLRVINGHTGG